MKIEAGKYYRLRNGEKVGPVYESCGEWVADHKVDGDYAPMWNLETGVANFMSYGPESDVPEYDIVAEWIDPEAQQKADGPTLSSHTIDQIAIDSLKWHYKEGNDLEPLQREAFRIVLSYYGVNL